MKHCNWLLLAIILFSGCKKGMNGSAGADGKNSLIDFVAEPNGSNCANGGYKVMTGLDKNSNSVLDASEIQNTKYICNGGGVTGTNGKNSLISFLPEAAGANCSNGGYKVNSGLDANGNNLLDAGEVQSTIYICNGSPGKTSLINIVAEAQGANCMAGGFKVTSGIDQNSNGVLDANEVQNTKYVCNGLNGTGGAAQDGLNSLISVVEEPIGNNCAGGGYKINYGLDKNRNNILDASEVTGVSYMCNANRVYAAVVSQQGTNAPIGIPLINNLDLTITWSRISIGVYRGVLNKAMNLNKTLALSNMSNLTAVMINPTTIELKNECAVNSPCDGFENATIGILVAD